MYFFPEYRVNSEDYECEERPMSEGCFGNLYKCTKKATGDKFVRRILSSDFESEASDDKFFNNELSNFSRIKQHPAIEIFEGYSSSDTDRSLYCEYYENGSLANILDKISQGDEAYKALWDSTAKSKTVFGVAAALLHIHSHKTVHRYLSAKRILFDSFMNPHISDFGYARAHINQTASLYLSKVISEPIYIPPELLDNDDSPQETIDSFAFGTILYQIVTSEPPFKGFSLPAITKKMMDHDFPEVPNTVAPVLKNFIEKCWSNQRPSFAEIVYYLKNEIDPLFEGTDMTTYEDYRTEVYKKTYIDENALKIISNIENSLAETEIDENTRNTAKKADEGDLVSMYIYGCQLLTGNGIMKNEEEAFYYFKKAAEQDFPLAVYRTARLYEDGRGVAKDMDEALRLMKRSYELNVPNSFMRYGSMLEKLDRNEEAFEVFKAGAEKGIGECFLKTGEYYLKNDNITEAISAYRKAASKNIAEANNERALLYLEGHKSFEANVSVALMLFRQSMNSGCGAAAWNLACLYKAPTEPGDKPRIVKPDEEIYIFCLKKAVELQNTSAIREYANILLGGLNGIEKDEAKGKELLKSACNAGDATAMYIYANLCKNGIGGDRDIRKAKKYSKMAIKAGYKKGYLQFGKIIYEEIKAEKGEIDKTTLNLCNFYLNEAIRNGFDEAKELQLDLAPK